MERVVIDMGQMTDDREGKGHIPRVDTELKQS